MMFPDQLSTGNPKGKRKYSRDFLIRLQGIPLSMERPIKLGDYHTLARRTMEIILPEGHIILPEGCIIPPEGRRRPQVEAARRRDNAARRRNTVA